MEFNKCRECDHRVSKMAFSCPGCGAPYPANERMEGWGYEYKSEQKVFGLPLIHISIKIRPNGVPVPAKGFIAIGQFGIGVINISQFGIGLISISQFTIAGFALAQIAIADSLVAQIGIYIHHGFGQVVWKLSHLLW